MIENLRTILWHQFGASIDMLENAIQACPENIWAARAEQGVELDSEGSNYQSFVTTRCSGQICIFQIRSMVLCHLHHLP